MAENQYYAINTDVKFDPLSLIDVDRLRAEASERWFNQTLCRVNDAVVRVGVVQGEFHWHRHEAEDEFFFVIDGRLLIDVEDHGTVELGAHQGFTVPRGVLHRTRAPERTAMLMIESASVHPTGDPP